MSLRPTVCLQRSSNWLIRGIGLLRRKFNSFVRANWFCSLDTTWSKLWRCVCVCVCVCVYVCLCLWMCMCVCLCLCCIYLCICVCVCECIYLSVSVYVCLCVIVCSTPVTLYPAASNRHYWLWAPLNILLTKRINYIQDLHFPKLYWGCVCVCMCLCLLW